MSIGATGSNYISHDSIDAWMEMKLDDAYGEMRAGMDTSGHRTDAEKALNGIKSQLLQSKTNGKDASEVTAAMHQAIDEFGDEFPDVKKALEGFVETLDKRSADAFKAAESPTYTSGTDADGNQITVEVPPSHSPAPVYIDTKEVDDWTTGIGNAVDGLGKDDQLGLLNLNQLNSHINQTEQIASALMDSRNKTLDSIINRIG
ncbi:MAG: hypothetical protein WDO69_30015 [Pseudomonadota bacterium]